MSAETNDLAGRANFIFSGTVQRLKAATVQQIPVDEHTAIVRVDEVLLAQEVLRYCKGKQITVKLAAHETVKKGQRAVFYTNEWLFGESLVVQSIGHAQPGARSKAKSMVDPVEAHSQRHLRQHFERADFVITGRVVAIRLPANAPRAFADGTTIQGQRFSEHDPVWRVAQVEIQDVHKGVHRSKTVEIGFPSSTDIAWAGAPKLQPGHEGHFLLHRQPPMLKAPGADLGDYVVLHPMDFQPREQLGGIKFLIAGPRDPRLR